MGWNRKFIHGPRFISPKKLKDIFTQGLNQNMPRYVMGFDKKDSLLKIQSVIRPIFPGEEAKIKSMILWDGTEFIFPTLRISPMMTIDGKEFSFYSFAFDKQVLKMLLDNIREKHNYRIKKRTVSEYDMYFIYQRLKKPMIKRKRR